MSCRKEAVVKTFRGRTPAMTRQVGPLNWVIHTGTRRSRHRNRTGQAPLLLDGSMQRRHLEPIYQMIRSQPADSPLHAFGLRHDQKHLFWLVFQKSSIMSV